MAKIVWIDWGVFLFRSIFAGFKNKGVTATFTCLNMIVASLKRVGLDEDDIVVIAVDSPKGSWRREVDSNYKADRKEKREKQKGINWAEQFSSFKGLLENIEASTPFHIIQIEKLESDDIISYGVRKFNNSECVIVSSDSDFEQLTSLSNVKVFSPISKKYKIVKNPLKTLAKKIQKETSDNLTTAINNSQQYNDREKIVSLLKLPKEIEERIEEKIQYITVEKDFDLNLLRSKFIREKFPQIYSKDFIVTLEDSMKKKSKRKKRKKNEKKNNKLKRKEVLNVN